MTQESADVNKTTKSNLLSNKAKKNTETDQRHQTEIKMNDTKNTEKHR